MAEANKTSRVAMFEAKNEWRGHTFSHIFHHEIKTQLGGSTGHRHTSGGAKGSSARLSSASGPRSVCRNRAAFRLRSACSCFSFHSLEAWASFSRAAAAKRSSSFCLAVLRKRRAGLQVKIKCGIKNQLLCGGLQMIRDFHFVEGIFLHLKRMRDYHKKN